MVIIYVLLAVVANILVSEFGPVMIPINSFFLIGADMVIRDKMHNKWKGKNLWLKMILSIASAGVISALISPGSYMIAFASFASFFVSSIANTIVYDKLFNKEWMIKSNGSNAVGSVIDSFMFPTIAFGVIMPEIVIMQIAMKTLGSLFWSCLIKPVKR